MEDLEAFVSTALSDETIELEIRIGKIAFGRFRTEINEAAWNRAIKSLSSYKKWTKAEVQSFTDERFENGIRKRTHADGRVELCKKERLEVRDIAMPGHAADLRLSLAKEHVLRSIVPNAKATSKEFKKRHRFVHKDIWAFELTEMEGASHDIDSECTKRHQIEIEFCRLGAQKYPCMYLADYGKLLAEDVLSMIDCKPSI